MASPTKFFEQDGPYSWIVLITLILCNFSSFGFLMGTLGPLSDLFPQVFDRDQAETNIISSTALAVFSFASKCMSCVYHRYELDLHFFTLNFLSMQKAQHSTEWKLSTIDVIV